MDIKYKRLLGDTVLFAISNFGSKILTFLLVPLYTSILSTEEYGIADIILTTVSLLYPILTLSICDATLRFTLDNNVSKRSVKSNSLLVVALSCVILLLVTPLIYSMSAGAKKYWWFFASIYIVVSLQCYLSNYVRGCGKTKLYAAQGILYTIVLIVCNIVFLLIIKIGLQGYLLSVIIANICSCASMIIFMGEGKSFSIVFVDKGLMKEMLRYSIPLIPTSIAWWISASADKYMLIGMVGIGANGLYAVAHKIPSIFSTLIGLFSRAWRISAISNYNLEDGKEFYEIVYGGYRIACIYSCVAVTMCSELFAHLLFKEEYYNAWVLVPPLILAALFEAFSGFLESIYAATKKTNLLFVSTGTGAVLNIILNNFLIRTLGVIGAPIATFISFSVVWGISSVVLKRVIKIYTNYAKLLPSLCLLVFGGLYFSYNLPYKYLIYSVVSTFIVCINWQDTRAIICRVLKVIKREDKLNL